MTSAHVQHSLDLIRCHLPEATNPVVWASGGKDSLVLLHLMAPRWTGYVTILHTALDDGWPGQTANLIELAEKWGYKPVQVLEPKMTFDNYVTQYGWPVEIVPSAFDGSSIPSPLAKPGPRMASWVHCQINRMIIPLVAGSAMHKSTLVLTGSKNQDGSAIEAQGEYLEGADVYGWNRLNPLSGWSDADVYDYVDLHGIPLPPHYQFKRHSGSETEWSDCLSCTWNPGHWRILKAHYPEEYAKRWPQVKPVFEALAAETTAFSKDVNGLLTMDGGGDVKDS